MKILVINGPNMNMLGIREPEIYGTRSYDDLICFLTEGRSSVADLSFFQSNHEGAIVDAIHQAYYDGIDGIVINAAAYTHTSIAISDAISAVGIPAVEVHLSDPLQREEYRHTSYLSDVCIATISGKGFDGYTEAIDLLLYR